MSAERKNPYKDMFRPVEAGAVTRESVKVAVSPYMWEIFDFVQGLKRINRRQRNTILGLLSSIDETIRGDWPCTLTHARVRPFTPELIVKLGEKEERFQKMLKNLKRSWKKK